MITPALAGPASAGCGRRGSRAQAASLLPPTAEFLPSAADAHAGRPGTGAGSEIPVPVLVIGGGIAGCSLAYGLARRGVAVRLIEKGRVGQEGASAVGAALLNPYRGRGAKPGRYDLDGLAAFWRLAGKLEADGHAHGARRSGVLRVASSARQARVWNDLPGLRFQPEPPHPYRAPEGAFLVPDGGWLEPSLLLSSLAAAAAKRGGEFVEGCEVERLERRQGTWLAHTSVGPIAARVMVLCTGAGAVRGIELPGLERIAGDQVTLASSAPLPYPIAGAVYLASTGDRVLVGGNHRPPEQGDPHAPELLRSSAARMVPPLLDAPIERVWTGIRAKRPDNIPLVTEIEPRLWFLGAFGGRGFLTAPLLADRLASILAGD
jgi:glycine oxidase